MNKKTFIVILTIVVIISSLLYFLEYTQQEKLNPEEVITRYYTLLNEYNLEQAKKLMTDEMRKESETYHYYLRWVDVATKRGMLKDVEITESRIYEKTAIITFKLIYTDGKSLKLKQQLTNDGKWKISSSSDPIDSLEYSRQAQEVPE